MIKKINIGGNTIKVEYQGTYRPDSIRIDGIEYSMTRYAERHNGKNWEASPRGNVLFYEAEDGRSYGIPQKKFTDGMTEAAKKAQKKYDEAHRDQWRMVHLKLNKETDKAIIEKLEASGNIQGYIKNLIQKDIENPKS